MSNFYAELIVCGAIHTVDLSELLKCKTLDDFIIPRIERDNYGLYCSYDKVFIRSIWLGNRGYYIGNYIDFFAILMFIYDNLYKGKKLESIVNNVYESNRLL